jgi:hypothetical protein
MPTKSVKDIQSSASPLASLILKLGMLAPLVTNIVMNTLGHNLLSIRDRALQSILFKLSHNIVTLDELSVDPYICLYLLEWFNKDEVQDEEAVLLLLIDLSKVCGYMSQHAVGCALMQCVVLAYYMCLKHLKLVITSRKGAMARKRNLLYFCTPILTTLLQFPISGNRLVEIGAISFLQSLRHNSPPVLYHNIDELIDFLSHVPPLPAVPSPHSPKEEGKKSVAEKFRDKAQMITQMEDDVDSRKWSN